MSKLGRVRKAILTALGMAATLIVLVPEEHIPERWRPAVGIVLAAGTIFGVYKVRNDQPPRSREELAAHLPTRAARPEERRRPPFDGP
jgi:hypothetical protein